ncbi:Y4yA family PLP-dependent enzyme [Actinoplanes bogorensis]|uniref:Y4yA family PLP-dependent enzyme n=1 Tax=Paractinoplanes bogorensis TaxID=1610840 RepID=A0ABS5YJ31_9ACTN|nr:Y4yA family PLP-dependent enzyme [Actinoplanes bogorensis]MBU2663413.1 Y4yA family PLP-dependent enzyme [Actinoplanes bogorensis]
MTDSRPLTLTPRIEPSLQSVLDETELLHQLADGLGSPLNIVLPGALAANVEAFRAVYRRHHLRGHVYFAHKANRSSALLRELATTEAGVDVASLGELQHALGAGFTPDRIVATGPKNRDFLGLAVRTGVLISVDSLDELLLLQKSGARVLLRLSGFTSTGVQTISRRSRFGIPFDRLDEALDRCEEIAGIAYHLDTIGPPEKAVALEGCLAAIDECRRRGLPVWSIDIGGGFGVNYLADGAEWERYTTELGQAVLGRRAPMTWNDHGYGLRNEAGTLRGALGLYPAYRPVSGPGYLDQLLATPAPEQRRPLGELLLDSMIDLDIEPGRALLDQAGLVLARVVSADGEIVRLDINAGDVSLEEHGVLMDPVLVGDRREDPTEVFLLGNLCLESDLITRRKVTLPARPRPGDLLAFVNTAGYFMDFSATRALHQSIARTVAVSRRANRWTWCLDDQYWPVHGGAS